MAFMPLRHRHLPVTLVLAAAFVVGCSRAQLPRTNAVAAPAVPVAAATFPELRVGGRGSQPGQFADLRDFRFAPDGDLWTLEGAGQTRGAGGRDSFAGNNRVQHLRADGTPVSQFPLDGNGKSQPYRIAVDTSGVVYVSFNAQERVAAYDQNGRLIRNTPIPHASGLAACGDGMAVLSGAGNEDGDAIVLIEGAQSRTIKLSQKVQRVRDLSCDARGHFWVLGWINQVYEFDANGQLVSTVGAGTDTRPGDGSVWLGTIAVSDDGATLYGLDAGKLLRRSSAGEVTLRPDSLGTGASFVRAQSVRLDGQGRPWIGDFSMPQGNQAPSSRPVIARLASDAFAGEKPGVAVAAAAGLGLNPTLTSPLPGNIAYGFQPFPLELRLPAANRNVRQISVQWVARDADKNAVGQGTFNLNLNGGDAATQNFNWTPPRFGWYQVTATVSGGGQVLDRAVALCGVTPPFVNLPRFERIEGLDRREDVPRQVFSGLPAMRLEVTDQGWLDLAEKVVPLAQKYGANLYVLFPEARDVRPEWVSKTVSQFRGRIHYYELVNEPDLKMKPGEYADLIRPAVAALRQADPDARVLGPGTVQIRLDWMKQFLDAGGADLVDEWSFHPYEGHESTDPNYLNAKLTAMRALLARYGKADIPFWQTEHAIAAQRANLIWPNIQAERWLSDRDVFQNFGIPIERDSHFYLNPRGYGKVPSYAWTNEGPLALPLLARVRYALTKGRNFGGALNFGPNGNALFSGGRYDGAADTVYSLRAQDVESGGKLGLATDFLVAGAAQIEVIDAWGNRRNVPVTNNRVTLQLDGMPTYIRAPRSVRVVPVALNWGDDIAHGAQMESSNGNAPAILNDGVLQSIHYFEPGYNLPPSDVRAGSIFRALLAAKGDDTPAPATVTARWNAPRDVRTIVLRGIRADNQHCALLDYDIQAEIGGQWRMVASVNTPVPASELGGAMDTEATSWSHDIANHVVQLAAPVRATAIRLVARRATRGLVPDQFAIEMRRRLVQPEEPMMLDLSEIEIYG